MLLQSLTADFDTHLGYNTLFIIWYRLNLVSYVYFTSLLPTSVHSRDRHFTLLGASINNNVNNI